ncbi:hypothetical protein DB347_14950 [Opitutaceae bacterium EW11]|nr:hypothetical protein DB347_14950 [Opitutaceae bacterium EW11]
MTPRIQPIAAGLTLLIPAQSDPERNAVAEAFKEAGGTVLPLDRFWEPPALEPSSVRIYGPDTFCLVLQQKLGLMLNSPADDLLLRLPKELLGRTLRSSPLAGLDGVIYPAFVKPVIPKQFRAGVFPSHESLRTEAQGLPAHTRVLISEVVNFTAEVRAFVLGGKVLDASIYEGGNSEILLARRTAESAAQAVSLPVALVADVGYIENRGWAVIEFNAAWGAGLNGCDARKVLPVIVRASSAGRLQ